MAEVAAVDHPLDATLSQALGAAAVSRDRGLRDLVSHDIWSPAPAVAARVIAPRDTAELAAALALLHTEGSPIAIRGGGMSYSAGYAPQDPRTTTLDLRRMDRVLSVDPVAMTASVQAGCTWRTLHKALKPLGLRTPFWGPLSGFAATVGGGVSQESVLFGSGRHGAASASVIALTVVLADGSVLRTGARRADGEHPFFRTYGPDLAGLFCGDCGAFGVKAEIVLRLVRTPRCEAHASFAFESGPGCVEALAELARAELTAEAFAFDPALGDARVRRVALRTAIRSLGEVAANAGSLARGIGEAARLALAGRPKAGAGDHALHLTCEGRSQAAVDADLSEVRAIVAANGGREIPNTLPTVLRAKPFRPLNGVLGAEGERWAPVHGLVSLADAQAACSAVEAFLAEQAPVFEAHGVVVGLMLSIVSTHAFLIEAVFTWPDVRYAVHEEAVEPQVLARLPVPPDNPAARALVAEARSEVVRVLGRFGCAHLQIGRAYPYRSTRDAASLALLDAVKAVLDLQNRLNPGVLGFPA